MTKKKFKPRVQPCAFDPAKPHKFRIGEDVWVWGFREGTPFRIRERSLLGPASFPHYTVQSASGELWIVPQLHLSRKALE